MAAVAVSVATRPMLLNSLIMLRNAAIAPFAMFTSQWLPNHTRHAEVLFVKLPQTQEFVDGGFLLTESAEFRHISWFVEHRAEIEVSTKTV